MPIVDLVMPKLGESIMEATILKWHKNPGDQVKMDETILDIATDKVDSEVPSSAEGILQETLFKVNDVVPVGAVIARIKTGAGEEQSSPKPDTKPSQPAFAPTQPKPQAAQVTSSQYKPTGNPNRFYSPLVLTIAASEGIGMQELESIPGTGNEGRVTKKDILQYINDRQQSNGHQKPSQGYSEVAVIDEPKQKPESAASFFVCSTDIFWQCGDNRNGQNAQTDRQTHGRQRAHQSACNQLFRSGCNEYGFMERQD